MILFLLRYTVYRIFIDEISQSWSPFVGYVYTSKAANSERLSHRQVVKVETGFRIKFTVRGTLIALRSTREKWKFSDYFWLDDQTFLKFNLFHWILLKIYIYIFFSYHWIFVKFFLSQNFLPIAQKWNYYCATATRRQRGLIGLASTTCKAGRLYSTLNQPMQRYNNERVITKVGRCFRTTFENAWYTWTPRRCNAGRRK